jgi:hypothetical protein
MNTHASVDGRFLVGLQDQVPPETKTIPFVVLLKRRGSCDVTMCGLDDYVALPFVFGAAQLINHREITPENVITPEVACPNRDEYLYCRRIDHA